MIRPAVIAKDGRGSGYSRISGSNRPPFRLANQTMAQSTNYPPYKLPNTVPIKGPANMYPTAAAPKLHGGAEKTMEVVDETTTSQQTPDANCSDVKMACGNHQLWMG